MKASLQQRARYSTCLRWSVMTELANRKPRDVVFIQVFLRIGHLDSIKVSSPSVFTQLIIGLITVVICAVVMQDHSLGHVLASNHSYFLLLSVSLCVSAVPDHRLLQNAIGYSDNLCRVCVFCAYWSVFGDVCVAELLMQCKSNLPHGRCDVCCLLCRCVCVCAVCCVCETLSERRKEQCCN